MAKKTAILEWCVCCFRISRWERTSEWSCAYARARFFDRSCSIWFWSSFVYSSTLKMKSQFDNIKNQNIYIHIFIYLFHTLFPAEDGSSSKKTGFTRQILFNLYVKCILMVCSLLILCIQIICIHSVVIPHWNLFHILFLK